MRTFLFVLTVAAAACGGGSRLTNHPPGGKGPGGGTPNLPGCTLPHDSSLDLDHDGYTGAMGDCNDCNPTINPGAIQIPGDSTDYSCNGMPGVVPACDAANLGMRDATSLANAFENCDPRFFLGATLVGPADLKARKVIGQFGILTPRMGKNFALLSSGIAADKMDPDYSTATGVDPGTDFGASNTYANPLPALAGVAGCSQSQPPTVNDYTELVLKLKAPTNVSSFSFDFQFFSAEYPVYVCTQFNDEFLVLQESAAEFGMATNIAFDMQKNPVTVNNGFFTVCQNDPSKPQTQHCTHPVTDIAGTGYEDTPGGIPCTSDPDCFGIGTCVSHVCQFGGGLGMIPGGSTGWLTTTSPVSPGENVTLHFIIFDEGDHILDSAALIDNFRWGTAVVNTPVTQPIQ